VLEYPENTKLSHFKSFVQQTCKGNVSRAQRARAHTQLNNKYGRAKDCREVSRLDFAGRIDLDVETRMDTELLSQDN